MTSPAIARTAKAALRRVFPGTKFSVTSSCNIDITWTDDGFEIAAARRRSSLPAALSTPPAGMASGT